MASIHTTEKPLFVDAILMASGFSVRFGEKNKLLAPFRGKPLALHTLQLACGLACFENIYFIYADAAVGHLAEGLPVQPVHNAHPQHGSRESVRLGVSCSSADYYMFFPCDQPLLDEATVRAVLQKASPGGIVVPEYEGQPGNPTLFSATYRQELLGLQQGQQARAVKLRHPGCVITVPIASALPLADVDTVDDLLKF